MHRRGFFGKGVGALGALCGVGAAGTGGTEAPAPPPDTRGVIARPGDTVVLQTDVPLSCAAYDRMRECLTRETERTGVRFVVVEAPLRAVVVNA